MALESFDLELSTTEVDVYECPAGLTALAALTVANRTGTPRNLILRKYRASLAGTIDIHEALVIPANDFVKLPPEALEAGDKIVMGASANTALSVSGMVDTGTVLVAMGFRPRGAWSGATTYRRNDVVSVSGTSYISLQDANLNNAPASLGAWWMHNAEKGTQGDLSAAANLSDLANVATGFNNIKQPATTAYAGVGEIADQTESENGSANDIFMSPLGVKYALQNHLEVFEFALSDETTNLTTGTAKLTWRAPYALENVTLRMSVTEAPTGAALIADVNKNGATMMTTNKLSIDATEKTSVTAATAVGMTTTTIASDDELTFDIDQVGSTLPGKGAKVKLFANRVA